jgi:hypothetical protein
VNTLHKGYDDDDDDNNDNNNNVRASCLNKSFLKAAIGSGLKDDQADISH